jgi:hypothetical protein
VLVLDMRFDMNTASALPLGEGQPA